MRFSIIMPVYNAGVFINAAISSILNQKFRDFELLLIDDGSTDGSALVCDEFALNDDRIRVFHRSNGGICNVRNFGIGKAQGEYIMFADHDDEYLPEYTSIINDTVTESTCLLDIIKVNFTLADRWPDGQRIVTHSGRTGQSCKWAITSDYELFERLTLAVWDGAYRRDFLLQSGVLFDETLKVGTEDFKFMLQCLSKTQNVYWRREVCYCHYNNYGISISSKYYERRINDIINVARMEKELFPTDKLKRELERFRRWNSVIIVSGIMIKGVRRSIFRDISVMYDLRRELLPIPPTHYENEDGLSRAEKVFVLIFRFHLFWLYCLITLIKCR